MDRDKRRSYNRRQRAQEQRLLAQIARGDTAQNVLCVLCASVESSIGRGVRCAVHLPDGDGARIVQVIAPSFEGYFQRRGPVAIDPTGGSSAAAAYLRRQIVLGQIDNNTPVLKGADTLFTGHGMRAICATPVLSRGSVLAVVSVYYVQPGVPSREDQQVIEWATRIASIVLGHERAVYALTQSETKYRSFLDHLRDGVFITQEGIVVYANPAITELTGRAAQDLLGSDFHAMLATEDAAMLRSLEAMHLRGARAPNECTLRIVRADGDLRTMRINQAAITWNDAPASLSTLTDITERQRAEQEVRRLNAELERRVGERTRELAAVNRELEAFSYSVSHDLRAPVRAINGFSAMLLNKHAGALDADARLHLERVYGAGQRMDEMIEGLLALARIARAAPRFGTVGMSEIA
ncbi:MAG: PAS domain S-box protein, partial [Burkholderiales bacterium]